VSAWAAFLLFATNQEKLASSIVKQILQMVRENEELKVMLGDAIRPEPAWYLNGDPWIHGSVIATTIFMAFTPSHYFVLLD
jgi:cytochrome c oxidase assembly factor 1